MELWTIFAFFAAVFFLIGLVDHKRTTVHNGAGSGSAEPLWPPQGGGVTVSTDSDFSAPAVWDENAITRQLGVLRHESPGVIAHFIDSVKRRFIINQNDKTAVRRIQFLQRQFEQLKLVKSCAEISVDLEALSKERQIRLKKLDIEARDLDIQMAGDDPLKKLNAERDQLKVQVEIFQLKQQLVPGNQPQKPKASPYDEAESEYERIKKHRAKRLAGILAGRTLEQLPPEEQEEYRVEENMCNDAIQRAREKMYKHL